MAIIADKKFRLCLLIAVIAVLAIGAWFWYYIQDSGVKEVPEEEIAEEETEIEKQLRELEELRKRTPSLTEEEIKDQLEELENLRQETQSLSQEEIEKQLEELEKLR